MIKKIDVEIVTGFLGAGKTTFINVLLGNTLAYGQRVLIFQNEIGEKSIEDKYINSGQVNVGNVISMDIIKSYKPHRIIIEHNGATLLQDLLDTLNQDEIRKNCSISTIFNILDAESFELYLNNMESLIFPPIYNSNLIIMNNFKTMAKKDQVRIKKKIEEINSYAIILGIENINHLEEELLKACILRKKILKNIQTVTKNYFQGEDEKALGSVEAAESNNGKIIMYMILGVLLLFVFNGIRGLTDFNFNLRFTNSFFTIFISIMLEAIPFILLGSFISAVIQVFVSDRVISKVLPKNKFLGIMGASLIGFVFPICECAVVPIARRLMKKGVPASIAVTFMLAVPIVNPVVLLSTYSAFYDRPSVVLLRAGFGILAAVTIGFLIEIVQGKDMPVKGKEFESDSDILCGCGYNHQYSLKRSKILNVLEHTTIEFFDISKYLIIGAVLSSVFQTFVPRSIITPLGMHTVYSIIVMMLLAFVLSVCSEADAFIARTFLNQFTLGSVSAFMIIGPMLDIKNTIMLGASFKKGFVIRLIVYIFSVCYIIGCIINILTTMGVV
ncbi:permease [Clostridium sp. BJN0013]|uniref:permease n=1 Tax=Clostridium sp. BJN0013 TaxID=3236840 RepID=UPI0034C5F70D